MESTIEVHAQFDFKGETYRPSLTLDLDRQMESLGALPDIYPLLARVNQIDPYSYQYEILESCELEFANATGLAEGFLRDGRFDAEGFKHHWYEQKRLEQLEEIARRHLGVNDLEQQPGLKAALLDAYEAGKSGAY